MSRKEINRKNSKGTHIETIKTTMAQVRDKIIGIKVIAVAWTINTLNSEIGEDSMKEMIITPSMKEVKIEMTTEMEQERK